MTRHLENKGWLERDAENSWLLLDAADQEDDTLSQLQGHSINYRIEMGPHRGRKVLTLKAYLRARKPAATQVGWPA